MLNFVICDDNIQFLNHLDKTLNKIILKNDFNAKVGFKSTDVSQVLDYMKNTKVDVLFLDIQLKTNINGLDVAEKIRTTNKDIYIIFTTAHLEYALLAFQFKAFDFIAKPITAERLEETIVRLFEDIDFSSSNFIALNNKTYINQADICYIKKDGMKLVFKTKSNVYETYSSFNKIADKLSNNFVRCHKSYIANVNNISHIDANTLFFNSDAKCYIGPKYRNNFMEVINNDFIPKSLDSSNNS